VTGGVLVWLAVKAAMAVLAVLAVLVPAIRGGPSVTDPAGLAVPDAADGFFGVLHHWDSGYFQGIAADGYFPAGADSSVQSFFPGYPAAARGVAEIITFGAPTDAALTVAMWLVSAVASVAAAVLLWRLVEQEYLPGVARWATVLLVTGPYSMFLFADYSESAFLAFAVAAWYCAVKHRWALVGVFAAAATFTRINGVFLVAAMLVLYVQQRRRTGAPVIAAALWRLPVACTGIAAYFGCDVPHRTRPAPWR
jgi:Gpi18-like mannosyltransferase